MKFTKMQGIGNDYVYVNCFREQVENPSQVAIKVSDRHFGVGSDGLILIKPSDVADFEMEMYNADGSQGAMCGNGIRCVAKYVYDYHLTDKNQYQCKYKKRYKISGFDSRRWESKRSQSKYGRPDSEYSRNPYDLWKRAGDCTAFEH